MNQPRSTVGRISVSAAVLGGWVALIAGVPTWARASGTPEMLFESGMKAYLDGDWTGALDRWREIERQGYRSGELFYNMGNAYYKLSEIGEAILYWERAARLLGDDPDLAANLSLARRNLVDRLDETVRLPLWDWFDAFRARLPLSTLAGLAPLFCFASFAALAARRWLFRTLRARAMLKAAAVAAFVLLALNLGLFALKVRDESALRAGVLTVTEAEVWSAPASGTGKLLFTLHEGTKVKVLREVQGWYEISAGKDRQGWIRKEKMGLI